MSEVIKDKPQDSLKINADVQNNNQIDKLRDIIVGSYSRDFEAQIQQLSSDFKNKIQNLEESHELRVENLEKFFQAEVKSANEEINHLTKKIESKSTVFNQTILELKDKFLMLVSELESKKVDHKALSALFSEVSDRLNMK